MIKHLSYRKDSERSIGAIGRHFKLDVKNRIIMVMVYTDLHKFIDKFLANLVLYFIAN